MYKHILVLVGLKYIYKLYDWLIIYWRWGIAPRETYIQTSHMDTIWNSLLTSL